MYTDLLVASIRIVQEMINENMLLIMESETCIRNLDDSMRNLSDAQITKGIDQAIEFYWKCTQCKELRFTLELDALEVNVKLVVNWWRK